MDVLEGVGVQGSGLLVASLHLGTEGTEVGIGLLLRGDFGGLRAILGDDGRGRGDGDAVDDDGLHGVYLPLLMVLL